MRRARGLLPPLLAVALLAGLAAGPAAARMNKEERARFEELVNRVARLERLLESHTLQEMYLQLEELDRENRTLRGEVEELRHALDRLKQRQRELYLDMDKRLQALEAAGTAATAVEAPEQGEPAGTEAAGQDEQAAYRAAFDLLKDGKYREAARAFGEFLQKFPQSPLAANAQYWLGEAYYGAKDYKQAIQEFEKVRTLYPDSPKVPDATLKLGYSYYALKRWKAARKALEEVVERFSGTSVARLAEQRLKRMRREGH